MSNPDQSPALSLEEFRHWLNNRRMMDVSMAFGDIVERYREATEAAAMAATVPAEPVALDHIACIEDGELRFMSGRKAPAYDCELYAMPDGKNAPPLFAQAPVAGQPAEPSPAASLSDAQIKAAVHSAVKAGKLSWAGYEKDEAGEYTVPVLSPKHYQLARAIEAAHGITAPSTPTQPEVAP